MGYFMFDKSELASRSFDLDPKGYKPPIDRQKKGAPTKRTKNRRTHNNSLQGHQSSSASASAVHS
ncbi:hypothetical protein, partial [Pseudomonas helleri]|uniref:hypothetical protein n=1 Tax=Pseudomonas helleri TaxID=1608996 RepID=UPI003F9C71D6